MKITKGGPFSSKYGQTSTNTTDKGANSYPPLASGDVRYSGVEPDAGG